MTYCHTQKAPLHWLLHVMGIAMLASAWVQREEWPAGLILAIVGAVIILVGFMFAHLTVRDEGDYLAIRYGPLPVIRHRIEYADIEAVELGATSLIDGWGVHRIPGRGWTYNLWGRECAKLTVRGKTVRIGSDDAPNLVAFLHGKIDPRD